ncbi:uncharacterized protein LOC62_01G001418 [Vanrija pseudolonga]|uniref:Uncharacterized protein n=1 Tax=Vanrija pseudolonga TaxID=143232 RepID=A0AAF0Y0X2_9TREE|nr:hypothetical protein LOC62_01G001418 [Vanrija pseudolonga]
MPPKSTAVADDADAALPLQEWLKLLQSHGVPMRTAMVLASKVYKTHGSKGKLAKLGDKELAAAVPDKDQRKVVFGALNGIGSGKAHTPKRKRDDDLLRGLDPVPVPVPASFDFHEILDPERLLDVSVTVNRAPIKTAWAYAVARRRGFDAQEALSIAHVYVHISSLKHALVLGNVLNAAETREAEEEIRELPGEENYRRPDDREAWRKRRRGEAEPAVSVSSGQPWVGIMRAKIPVIERPDGTWRAIQKGVSVEPSVAYLYITRALKDHTGAVLGAMQLVAESYEPDELDVVALHLYNEFKPDVVEWGQRGSVSVASILEQVKGPVEVGEVGEEGKKAEVDAPAVQHEPAPEDSPLSAAPDSPPPKTAPPAAVAVDTSLEEYDEDGFDDAALLALPLP